MTIISHARMCAHSIYEHIFVRVKVETSRSQSTAPSDTTPRQRRPTLWQFTARSTGHRADVFNCHPHFVLPLTALLFASCGPSTGFGTPACERAEADLRVAVDASAPEHVLLRRTEELERACDIEPPTTAPARTEQTTTSSTSTLVERPRTPNTRYVNVAMTEERSSPGGPVENRIYRGQRVEITDRDGEWARVTELRYDPRLGAGH